MRLLQIRPCHLLGRVAATHLFRYGQLLAQALDQTIESWLDEVKSHQPGEIDNLVAVVGGLPRND